ncbi:MAG: oligosaccharide flippase family protein, partial [Chloroflexi bacterium]|nr:oligosaccharide flippase family protein [Chloroflexota bacterium]
MTILNTVHSTGLPQAVSRHVAARPSDAAAVLITARSLQLRATAGSALVVVAVAGAVGLGGDPLAPFLATAALTVVPHGLLHLFLAYDNGLHNFRRQATILVLYSVAKTVAVVALAVLYRGLGALVGYAASSLGSLLIGRRRVPDGDRFDAMSLIRFAAPVIALVGVSATLLNVDLLLVQAFGGSPQDTGWYAAAQQVARAPYFALTGLGMALLPIVARREAEDDRSGLAATVGQATRYALILLAPAVALLAVAAPATIELLYSAEYAPGAAALPALMPGMAGMAVFSILASVLTGIGRPWVPVAIAAVGLAATTASAVVLIPTHGLV